MNASVNLPLVTDTARLAVLRDSDILDTPAEGTFDDIVEIAAALCDAPIALVSLVEEERQWFKARLGLEMEETPISHSVCAHLLDRTEPLVIPDLSKDQRTRHNPLVTAADGIRFYAGAPIRTATGHVLGALCVIDTEPRPGGLSKPQRDGLEALARQVLALIAIRRRLNDREASLVANFEQRRALDERIQTIDAAHAVIRMATFRFEIGSEDVEGTDELSAIYGQKISSISQLIDAVVPEDRATVSTPDNRADGTAPLDVVYRIRRADDGQIRWVARRASFEKDADGNVTHMICAIQDVTEQTLINEELNHRLKNMMTMVSAIAAQTFRELPDRAPVRAFEQRLVALSRAHDVLLGKRWSEAPMREVIGNCLDALGGPDITLGSKATVGLSLVIHELATNAMKYGALSVETGHVTLRWLIQESDGEQQLVTLWEEKDGPAVSPPSRRGFGARLISMGLLGAGGGQLDYRKGGLVARIVAPLERVRPA